MYSNIHHNELEPRSAPKPTKFQEISAKPEVPELSVVFESSENSLKLSNRKPSYSTSQTTQETYSEWKNRQNISPVFKETRYYEPRDKHYYGSSTYSDCDQNPPYNRFSDKTSYKSSSENHKCNCQNTPTVKDIYSIMQVQNDQIKFLLEAIQKLLVTVLSNQQNVHKCCCFEHNHCKQDGNFKTTELIQKNEIHEKYHLKNSDDNQTEKLKTTKKNNEIIQNKNELKENSKHLNKPDITIDKSNDEPKISEVTKCGSNNDEKNNNKKEKERTYSIASDESLDLNVNDVQVFETPISPEQSIHIEMVSSEDSNNSESEDENKKIEVGWTMYKNIIGQVNNLLEDNKNELKSEVVKPVECVKFTPMTKPKNFESPKHFTLPENNQIDSSLQMQSLAMQYLSPEQAIKFDINKHFVPTTQPTMKSPNNYSISTLHYMERYHLIAPEKKFTTGNPQNKLPVEGLLNKKKKLPRKNKTPSKILNITELKQQPKLS